MTSDPAPVADLSVHEVQQRLNQTLHTITDRESIPLQDALDRILAADVISTISVPPHDNSAMDGYAFDGAQLERAERLTLRVVGSVHAGQPWREPLHGLACVKIMTGAPMPAGLDTVVPLEMCTRNETSVDFATSTLRPGANRRRAGEDLMQGQAALQAGQLLTPAALGLLASLGLQTVSVCRRLRVACFSTGNEILSLGEAPREGAVYDSNRYTLSSLLTRLGVEVLDMGVVPDQPAALLAAFEQATREADAIVTSGGVSMGDADHTRTIMQQLGEVDFWRIAMRPGRPMAFGLLRSKSDEPVALFGLPGNPVAAMVAFLVFVRPAMLRLMGANPIEPIRLRAQITESLRKRPGRTEFPRAIVWHNAQGQLCVRTTGPQGSGLLSSMVQGNGLIVLPQDQGDIRPGELVDVMMFDGVI